MSELYAIALYDTATKRLPDSAVLNTQRLSNRYVMEIAVLPSPEDKGLYNLKSTKLKKEDTLP